MGDKAAKPTYTDAVIDRVKELMGRGVSKVQNTGTGATIKGRARSVDEAVDAMSGLHDRQHTDSNNRGM